MNRDPLLSLWWEEVRAFLTTRQRQVVDRRRVGDTHREIALDLGVCVGRSRVLLAEAVSRIRSRFDDPRDYSPWTLPPLLPEGQRRSRRSGAG